MDILSQDIKYLPGVGPNRKKMLSNELGIECYGDLLEYYPYKYVDRSKVYTIHELTGDMPFVQVVGHILSFETFAMGPRKERVVAHFSDGTGICDLTWFNGGKYAKQNYKIFHRIMSLEVQVLEPQYLFAAQHAEVLIVVIEREAAVVSASNEAVNLKTLHHIHHRERLGANGKQHLALGVDAMHVGHVVMAFLA